MNRTKIFSAALVLASLFSMPAIAGEPNGMFIMRTTTKSPDAVQAAIKAYVLEKKWLYVNDNKLKVGEVTQVRMCVPDIGKDTWKAGMHISALVPCGQIGIYEQDGVTKISMLHPGFMNALYPDPILKKAGEDLLPLLTTMLDEVVK